METNEHRIIINHEIYEFKKQFKSGLNMYVCPYMRRLFDMFAIDDVDRLDLKQLMQLGFHSDNMWREDFEEDQRMENKNIKIPKDNKTYYLHMVNGMPSYFNGEQIIHAHRELKFPDNLSLSLVDVKKERELSAKFRKKHFEDNGFDDFSYIRITIKPKLLMKLRGIKYQRMEIQLKEMESIKLNIEGKTIVIQNYRSGLNIMNIESGNDIQIKKEE